MTAFQPIELLPTTEAEELQLGAACTHVSVRKFLLKLVELRLLAFFSTFQCLMLQSRPISLKDM